MIDERAGLPSGSSFDRVVNCPGSVAAEREVVLLPDYREPVAEVALQGSAIHSGLETGAIDELPDDEQEIAAKLKEMEAAALAEWRYEIGCEAWDVVETFREERLWIRDRRTAKPIASSKLDVGYVLGPYALIIDYKTGYLECTPSERNHQLRIEALCAWHEFPDLTQIRVAIAHHRLSSKFDACDYSLADLQNSERDMLFHLWRTEQPNAPKYAGPWCRYCKAKAWCETAAGYSMLPATVVSTSPANLKGAELQEYASIRVATLPLASVAELKHRRRIMEAVLDAAEHRLRNTPIEDLNAVGLTLKDGKQMREPLSTDAVYSAVSDLIDRDTFNRECLSVGLGKVGELVVPKLIEAAKANKQKITKKAAEMALRERLLPAVTIHQQAQQVVEL